MVGENPNGFFFRERSRTRPGKLELQFRFLHDNTLGAASLNGNRRAPRVVRHKTFITTTCPTNCGWLKPANDSCEPGTTPLSPRSSYDAREGHKGWLPKKRKRKRAAW